MYLQLLFHSYYVRYIQVLLGDLLSGCYSGCSTHPYLFSSLVHVITIFIYRLCLGNRTTCAAPVCPCSHICQFPQKQMLLISNSLEENCFCSFLNICVLRGVCLIVNIRMPETTHRLIDNIWVNKKQEKKQLATLGACQDSHSVTIWEWFHTVNTGCGLENMWTNIGGVSGKADARLKEISC